MAPKERPSLTHQFTTVVDLKDTLESLAIDAISVNATRMIVIYRRAILDLDVTEGQLTDASAIAIHVWDEGDPPPETEPADLLTAFVVELEDTISE